jgi:hypothetical protein
MSDPDVMRTSTEGRPIAIGGIGGSGTRIVAEFLKQAGYHLGSDLNEANDNLWFTLLFKRVQTLIQPAADFAALANLFFHRMRGTLDPAQAAAAAEHLAPLARHGPQNPPDWLATRLKTFLDIAPDEPRRPLWGWKEPNTHVVIDRLLALHPRLRYIHVTRDAFYMARSANQKQLGLWGPVFLGREVERTPRDALAYWCAVEQRVRHIATLFPERVLLLNFTRFCRDPQAACRAIMEFCGRPCDAGAVMAFAPRVAAPRAVDYGEIDLGAFDPDDVRYARSLADPAEPAR